jgi:bacterioferritin
MDKEKVVEQLNEILRWEWAGLVQYQQHSFIVQDLWREVYAERFRESADEALKHARLIGDKIVALGGVPTVERAEVKQSTDLKELLQFDLELESKQVELYDEALKLVGEDDAPLRVLLEDIIIEEQEGVDDLSKILAQHDLAISSSGKKSRKTG